MGEPAELSEVERAKVIESATKIVESVINDEPVLAAFHDYSVNDRFRPTKNRSIDETEDAARIDASKLSDLEADVEYRLVVLSQVVIYLADVRKILGAAARMDAAELARFRTWCVARRDRVVEQALEIAKHWGDQGGVNGAMLDQLAELAGHPTRGYRRDKT